MRGIFLPSEVLEKLFKRPTELRLLIYLVSIAETEATVKYSPIHLKRGQCFISIDNLGRDCEYIFSNSYIRVSKTTAVRAVDSLAEFGYIEKESNRSRGTVFTILNFDSYMIGEGNENTNYHYNKSTRKE